TSSISHFGTCATRSPASLTRSCRSRQRATLEFWRVKSTYLSYASEFDRGSRASLAVFPPAGRNGAVCRHHCCAVHGGPRIQLLFSLFGAGFVHDLVSLASLRSLHLLRRHGSAVDFRSASSRPVRRRPGRGLGFDHELGH